MDRRARPYDRSGEGGELELESDAEQQQQHAEIGDRVDGRVGLETDGVESEAGEEIAHQRRQSHLLHGESEREGDGQRDGDLGHRLGSTVLRI